MQVTVFIVQGVNLSNVAFHDFAKRFVFFLHFCNFPGELLAVFDAFDEQVDLLGCFIHLLFVRLIELPEALNFELKRIDGLRLKGKGEEEEEEFQVYYEMGVTYF